MDLSLIAAASIDWSGWGHLAQGILALGLVILIHEFGHFAAAKLCGVKVEKFYIGFDPYGLRLCRFRWGETEYGIGAIPLGGYVYMLGQTDNPGKQAEEAERARAAAAQGEPVDPEAAAVWDPRSYPAQTVPERMLIISAGVILNTITAFLFATIAYLNGAEFTRTTIHGLQPGGVAWQRDIGTGTAITEVEGIREPRFTPDLTTRVVLGDLQKGVDLKIRREGQTEVPLNVVPRKMRPDYPPSLGIGGPRLTILMKEEGKFRPTFENTPARAAVPKFESEDEIVRIEDVDVRSYLDIVRAETIYADKPVRVTVKRKPAAEGAATTEVTTTVAPIPLRMLGMTMPFGPIVSVQENSPAMKAGVVAGDKLLLIDGEPIGDPITAAERLRRKQKANPDAVWKVELERSANGAPNTVTLDIRPRQADYAEDPISYGYLSLPTLGIAYGVPAVVAAVEAEGPAAKAGIKAGDVITLFKTVPSDVPLEDGQAPDSRSIRLTENDADNWPLCAISLAQLRADTKVELTVKTGDEERQVTLVPVDSKEFFFVGRGWNFQPDTFLRKAETLGQAFNYAYFDTRDALTQVYRFLHAMWIGQIPKKAVGGVITIAQQAGDSASGGLSTLLLFLMMLSCNLAVLNFLPFPVLDGGHMVLLAYEGIFRRPPPERFVGYLSIFGLVCLLFLMGFALKNDISRLAGWN